MSLVQFCEPTGLLIAISIRTDLSHMAVEKAKCDHKRISMTKRSRALLILVQGELALLPVLPVSCATVGLFGHNHFLL